MRSLNVITYSNDFSSSFTSRSLVDKGYVDNQINTLSNNISQLGRFRGLLDASTGLPSTTTFTNITPGDYWRITADGVITGLASGNSQLRVGDVLVFQGDPNNSTNNDPTQQSQYFSLQSNIDTSVDLIVGGVFTPTTGTISGSDTVKQALEKLQGNINALSFQSPLSFENGVWDDNGTVKLGSALTENTVIPGGGFSLSLGTTSDKLSGFEANSSNYSVLRGDQGSSLVSQGMVFSIAQGQHDTSFTDSRTASNKTGILLLGFGETDYSGTGANYSTLLGTSLVPKKYVDDLVSNSSITASNGLTLTSGVVRLGGTLTQNTDISGAFNLRIGTSSNRIGEFEINADQNINIETHGNYSDILLKALQPNSSIILNSSESIGLSSASISISGGNFIVDVNNSSNISLSNTSTNTGLSIDDNRGIFRSSNGHGIVYHSDYSSTFVNRSLVDKEYVDTQVANVAVQKYKTTISSSSITAPNYNATVNHNLNTEDVMVTVYGVSTKDNIIVPITRTSLNAIEIDFGGPVTEDYRVLVQAV